MKICNSVNKVLFNSLLVLILCAIFPIESNSQQDTSEIDYYFLPAVALDKIVQHSEVKIKNNYLHPGIVSGISGNDTIFIKDFNSLDTCKIETKKYDKLLFFWDYYGKTTKIHKTQYWYFDVFPKKEFEVSVSPIREIEGLENEMKLSNKELKGIVNEGYLYEIKITDEVNQNQVLVSVLEDALPFIDIIKIDTGINYARYHVKLKDKDEFLSNLSKEQKENWSKGKEVKFPIGVKLEDKNIPSYFREFDYVLVKTKQLKKTNN